MKLVKLVTLMAAAGMLSSCDLSQIPGLDKRLSIEDSRAIGAACRHSGRALEDCFTLNPMAHQAGVFDGWRDMNDYMMANKIEVVKPEVQVSNYKNASPGAEAGSAASHSGHVKGSEVLPSAGHEAPSTRPRWDPSQLGNSKPDTSGHDADGHGSAAPEAPSRPWERKTPDKSAT